LAAPMRPFAPCGALRVDIGVGGALWSPLASGGSATGLSAIDAWEDMPIMMQLCARRDALASRFIRARGIVDWEARSLTQCWGE
jgi:hypothetical protein